MFVRVLSLTLVGLINWSALAQTTPNVEISQMDETTHFEFSGLKVWNYDIQKSSDSSLALILPSLSEESEKKLKSYKDEFIKSIQVQRAPHEVKIHIELAQKQVEHFDYMTDEPSLLIVDLYRKAEEAKPAQTEAKKSAPKKKPLKEASAKEKAERKPAGEILNVTPEDPAVSLERRFGAFDSSDEEFGRFQIKDYEIKEASIIASKQEIFLKYPPLMMPVSRLDHWMNLQPEYVIKPTDTQENKEARLLQTLYVRGRENVYLKTYQYFIKKYPESDYKEILQNLAADIYLKRWQKDGKSSDYDQAKNLLSDLIERYSDSPLTQRNRFILGYAIMERGEALAALENFQELISLYPQSEEVPHLKLAEAEALMKLKKYDDAREVYKKITKDYVGTSFADQAQYRMGDVSMRSEMWAQAAEDYQKTLTDLKSREKDYANAHFNRGEALFWLGRYQEAVQEFAQFISLFPTHPYGAYAMTRIGELFDILGANTQRVMGAYLESYFRYPNHPGAKIARIRMLSKRMKSMQEKNFEKSLEEINKLKNEVKLPDTEEFVTILISEGYEEREDYLSSIDLLTSFYQKNPGSAHKEVIIKRAQGSIANEIGKRIQENNYLSALKFHQEHSKVWLKGADRIDLDYYRARSFELAGVQEEAQELYESVISRLEKISGTQEEKERLVEENLPSKDQVHLRIAQVHSEQRDYVAAYKTLKKIKDPKSLAPSEKIERTQLMADLWIQRGDYQDASSALEILIKEFEANGKEDLLASVLTKQAQVQNHLKNWNQGLEFANRALVTKSAPAKVRMNAYNEKARAQMELGLKASAIATLQDQLNEFEGKSPTEYTRYKLGELLFEEGDIGAAESIWTKLRDNGSGVLWKVAEEKLKSADFNKNYSRYIERIPAMNDKGDSGEQAQ